MGRIWVGLCGGVALWVVAGCAKPFAVTTEEIEKVGTFQSSCAVTSSGTKHVEIQFSGGRMTVSHIEYYFPACVSPYFTVSHTYEISVGDAIYDSSGDSVLGPNSQLFTVKKIDLTLRGMSFLYNAPPTTPATTKVPPPTTCAPLVEVLGGSDFANKNGTAIDVFALTDIVQETTADGLSTKCNFAFADFFDVSTSVNPSSWISSPNSVATSASPSYGYIDGDITKPKKLADGLTQYGLVALVTEVKDTRKFLYLSSMAKTEAFRPPSFSGGSGFWQKP